MKLSATEIFDAIDGLWFQSDCHLRVQVYGWALGEHCYPELKDFWNFEETASILYNKIHNLDIRNSADKDNLSLHEVRRNIKAYQDVCLEKLKRIGKSQELLYTKEYNKALSDLFNRSLFKEDPFDEIDSDITEVNKELENLDEAKEVSEIIAQAKKMIAHEAGIEVNKVHITISF
ncbi:hypothetical protein ABTI25_17580 [Acinetobacter baumannii]